MSTLTLNLVPDTECETPRSDDGNLCILLLDHMRYLLPWEDSDAPRGNGYSAQEHMDELRAYYGPDLLDIWPVWGYEHGGLSVRVSRGLDECAFSCPWDSGLLGFAVARHSDFDQFGDATRQDIKDNALEWVAKEIQVFDTWLRGDTWGFEVITADGDVVDSCYGFIGEDSARAAGLDAIDHESK